MKNAGMVTLLLLTLSRPSALIAEPPVDDSQHAPRFTLKLAAGVGFPRMSKPFVFHDLNWGGHTDGIDDYYQNYSGSLNYLIGLGVSVGLGYEFLHARGRGVVLDYQPRAPVLVYVPYDIDFPTHGAVAVIDKSWQLPKKALALELHAGIKGGHYWSSYNYTYASYPLYSGIVGDPPVIVPPSQRLWQGGSWGIEPMFGFSWLATRHLAVGIDGGYRWLGCGITASPIEKTDFTGPTVRFHLSTRF